MIGSLAPYFGLAFRGAHRPSIVWQLGPRGHQLQSPRVQGGMATEQGGRGIPGTALRNARARGRQRHRVRRPRDWRSERRTEGSQRSRRPLCTHDQAPRVRRARQRRQAEPRRHPAAHRHERHLARCVTTIHTPPPDRGDLARARSMVADIADKAAAPKMVDDLRTFVSHIYDKLPQVLASPITDRAFASRIVGSSGAHLRLVARRPYRTFHSLIPRLKCQVHIFVSSLIGMPKINQTAVKAYTSLLPECTNDDDNSDQA